MEAWGIIAIIYGCAMNLAGFISMGLDKSRAKRGEWRIPERTLFLIAVLGGSLGSVLGMQVFRHKTRHKQFVIGMPVILLLQLGLCGILFRHIVTMETTRTDFGMGTVITEVVYGPNGASVADDLYQCIIDLEEQELSWRMETASVADWNQQLRNGETVDLTTKEQQWIQDSLEICEASHGALDITIHPVIALWGIEGESPSVPSEEAIASTLTDIGYERLHLSEDGVLTGDTTECTIDLGAVGKGIAGDEVQSYLESRQVTGAIVSIGGTIVVHGKKPGQTDWKVGIQDPRGGQGSVMGVVTMKENGIISTSGDYEKYFMEADVRYHHIFDPATGYPADSGLIAVTVISDSGLVSDGLSTACFVLGYADGLSLLESYGAEGIFVTSDYKVYVTDGLQDTFTLTNSRYEMQ